MSTLRAFGRLGLAISLTIASPFARAASPVDPACKASPVEDARVKGRARRVVFPDGREITVVGHMHGDRRMYFLGQLAESGKLARLTDAQFAKLVRGLIAENREPLRSGLLNSHRRAQARKLREALGPEALADFDAGAGYELENVSVVGHAAADLDYVTSVLLGRPGEKSAEFIGWEGSDRIVKANTAFLRRARAAVVAEHALRRERGLTGIGDAEMRELMLGTVNGNMTPYVDDPRLESRVPLIGVEDDAAGEAHEKGDAFGRMDEALKALGRADDAFFDGLPPERRDGLKKSPRLRAFGARLVNLYNDVAQMAVSSDAELDRRVSALRPDVPEWVREPFDRLVAAFRNRIRLNLDRDAAAAKNLAALHRTGTHFVGLNHLRNLVSNLERQCALEAASRARGAAHAASAAGDAGRGTR